MMVRYMIAIEKERKILRLAKVGVLSHQTIAQTVGVSQGTVSNVVRRGYLRVDRLNNGQRPVVMNYAPSPDEIAKEAREIRRKKRELPGPRRWLGVVTLLLKG